jgi:tRNA-Thr(GGU) m(6)t(6)A37 methyltransferase TsaA
MGTADIHLRPLITSDEPFLWEMLYQALYVPEGQPPFPREILDDSDIACYVQGWGRPGDWGLLACDGETSVGAIWLRQWSGNERGYGYVDDTIPELSIALLPAYRRQGLGSRMFHEIFHMAGERYPGISLSVVETSPARRLYERLGFQKVGKVGGSLVMLLRWSGHDMNSICVSPVAIVHNPRTTTEDDDWGDVVSEIVLEPSLPDESLDGLETFSHAEIIFQFHLVDEGEAVCGARHPRENPDWPKVGIFAQRGRLRPNRLGLTVVRILRREGRSLFVEGLDAVDGTPVLDIKPMMEEFLPRGQIRQPDWTREVMKDYWKST